MARAVELGHRYGEREPDDRHSISILIPNALLTHFVLKPLRAQEPEQIQTTFREYQIRNEYDFMQGTLNTAALGLFVTTEGAYAAEYASVYKGGTFEITVPEATMTKLKEGGHIVPDLDPVAAVRGSFTIAPSGLPIVNAEATVRHIPHGAYELWSRFSMIF
jgi:hypothetical protein